MRPYSEYEAMTQGDRIAALYAEIDDVIAKSSNPEALRKMQNGLDQLHFKSVNGSAYPKMLAWLQASMANQSRALDAADQVLGGVAEVMGRAAAALEG